LPEYDPWIESDSQTLGCEDYLAVNTSTGVLTNNVWNKQAAEKFAWQQCLEMRFVDGNEEYGWSWSWPVGKKFIHAYPQIKLGLFPWAPEPVIDQHFPIRIGDITQLNVAYHLETNTNGQHNVATSMWITNSSTAPTSPAPESIVAELMIWTYSTAKHFSPA